MTKMEKSSTDDKLVVANVILGKLYAIAGISEGLLGPAVLLHDLCLLLRGEVVLDVEELTDLLHVLALDVGGDLSA